MCRSASRRLTGVLIALLALACNAAAAELPTSARADAVITAAASRLSLSLAKKGLHLGAPLLITIYKEERMLEVWLQASDNRYQLLNFYPICAVSGRLGPKLSQGDRQAPEGFYEIGPTQLNPTSAYHLALDLGFPNAYDRAQGRTGSLLMIHGDCVSVGCYAMTDRRIDEIYTLAYASLTGGEPSIPVHIFPFRMTALKMSEHAGSPYYDFWLNLKEGYDAFQSTGRPPKIAVSHRQYVVLAAPLGQP